MKTLIHVGLGKAGSTTLQKNIFEKLNNINYLKITDKDAVLKYDIDIAAINLFKNETNFDTMSKDV